MSLSLPVALIPLQRTTWLALFISMFLVSATCVAQQRPAPEPAPAPETKSGADAAASPRQTAPSKEPATTTHRFWDTQNRWLFAGVAAARTLDGTSTRNFRARGRDEGLLNNDIVDNAPAFAAIEFAGTAASIGTSYWMHRTGHHKLERWVSYLHIGVGFFGDARNYALPSIHRPPVVP